MTTTALTIASPSPTTLSPLPDHLRQAADELRRHSKAENTLRAYRSDLRAFTSWCTTHGLEPLPAHPDTLAAYVADQLEHPDRPLKLSTLRRHLATISKAHQLAGLPSPTRTEAMRDALQGAAKKHPQAPDQAPGVTPAQLRRMLEAMPQPAEQSYLQGLPEHLRWPISTLRDRALLLVGWCSALRRSELAALTWGCVRTEAEGMVLTLLGSKTDNAGTGQKAPLAATPDRPEVCPVKALKLWRDACADLLGPRGIADDQPVFRPIDRHRNLQRSGLTAHSIGQIIAHKGKAAGLEGLSGHSLRRGLIQAAHVAGVGEASIMQTSRHRSVNMVRAYQGDAGLLEQAASRSLL